MNKPRTATELREKEKEYWETGYGHQELEKIEKEFLGPLVRRLMESDLLRLATQS